MNLMRRGREARGIDAKPNSHLPHHATAHLAHHPVPHLAIQGRSKKQPPPPSTENHHGDQAISNHNQCTQLCLNHRQTRRRIHSCPRRGIRARACQVWRLRPRGRSIMRRVRCRILARRCLLMRRCRFIRVGGAAGMTVGARVGRGVV